MIHILVFLWVKFWISMWAVSGWLMWSMSWWFLWHGILIDCTPSFPYSLMLIFHCDAWIQLQFHTWNIMHCSRSHQHSMNSKMWWSPKSSLFEMDGSFWEWVDGRGSCVVSDLDIICHDKFMSNHRVARMNLFYISYRLVKILKENGQWISKIC